MVVQTIGLPLYFSLGKLNVDLFTKLSHRTCLDQLTAGSCTKDFAKSHIFP